MIYTWNIPNWINKNLGTRRRQPVIKSFIGIFIKPIEYLHTQFLAAANEADLKVKYSSQQAILKSLLNELFDDTLSRIRIETTSDAWQHPRMYYRREPGLNPVIYYRSEGMSSPTLRYRSESSTEHFTVFVPSSLASQIDEIKGWVDYYKEASKNYQIVYI